MGVPHSNTCGSAISNAFVFARNSLIEFRGGSRNSLRGGGFWARILRRGGGGGFIY